MIIRSRLRESGGEIDNTQTAASGRAIVTARRQAVARSAAMDARAEQFLTLQRTIGNANVTRLLATRQTRAPMSVKTSVSRSEVPGVQRRISFDGGTTIESSIPEQILGQATTAGPTVLALVRKWFAEPLITTTAKNWAEVLENAKAMAPMSAIDWGDRNTFDRDASDSDSETENRRREERFGVSPGTTYSSSVFNYTKKEGRKTVRGRSQTNRRGRQRVKPRVDNRVYGPEGTKGLAADATTIHDVLPKEIVDKRTGERKANQSYGATTVVCAVFRKPDGQLRKMCCSNADGPLAKALREKAEQLGYHVVRAEQAHAEGEMLQYLDQRKQMYSLYAMGCDKEHCKECDWAMKRTLGTYPTETAKSDKTFNKYYIPPSYARVLGQDYTFDNSPKAMTRHKKEPPKKKKRLDSAGASQATK